MKKKKYIKGIVIGMLIVAAVVMVNYRQTIVKAFFNTEKAVHIDPDTIENSTLIIGTHLIYLHSMNDQLYAIAMETASDSGQDKIYYKSELAAGTWYDITDAGSLSDITTAGTIAEKSAIQELYLTHHTKSDGITYDLLTNQPVCIFNINNVYDLENMPELEALKMQYDSMKEAKSDTDTAKRNLRLVQNFFSTQVTSEQTEACDVQINALWGYNQELVNNKADSSEVECVLTLMEKLDNARKASVFTLVEAGLSTLMDQVADASSSDEDISYDIDDALLTAVGNSQSALAESKTAAEGNMLSQGSSIVSNREYELSMELILDAMGTDYASCDGVNTKLQYLNHISGSLIVDAAGELELLDELINEADKSYQKSLAAGQTQEYNELLEKKSSHAALENRIQQDMVEPNAIRSELQFLIQGKTDRQDATEAQAYILKRIQSSADFKKSIQDDNYAQSMENSVDTYVKWLNELLRKVKEDDNEQSEADTLYEQKQDLQQQKQKALDNLDLDTAKKADAQIAAVDQQIDALEKSASDNIGNLTQQKSQLEAELKENPEDDTLLGQLSSIEAQIADAATNLKDDSSAANITGMKEQALEEIQDGDTSEDGMASLQTDLDGLTGMLDSGSSLALSALKEIYQKMSAKQTLEDKSAYNDLLEKLEQTIADSNVAAVSNGSLSKEQALQAIEDVMGVEELLDADGKLSLEVSQQDAQAALIALLEFARTTENDEAEALAGGLAVALSNEKSGAFLTHKSLNETFAPAEVLADYLGYRYLWNDTKKNAILSRGRSYYSFTAFRSGVENESGSTEYMDTEAEFADRIYIPDSYISSHFDCSVYDISGTDYSVLVNDIVVEKSQEMLSGLLEKGGY